MGRFREACQTDTRSNVAVAGLLPLRTIIGCAVLACAFCNCSQSQVRRNSALARRGLHHSNVSGRFVDPNGRPLSGIRVQIGENVQPTDYPLVRASSDAGGRFTFTDLSTSEPPVVRWFPPDQWVRGEMPIWGGSFEDIDLGSIELVPNTLIRVKVEGAGGKPVGRD